MSRAPEGTLERWGMVPLRAVVGIVFIMHGGQKLFVFGLGGAAAAFEQMGIPLPALSAAVVTFVELLGGLALLVGVLTRIAAVLLAIDMAVAILVVRLPGGFFAPQGFEFELTLFAACLTLAALGGGWASLDRVIAQRRTL